MRNGSTPSSSSTTTGPVAGVTADRATLASRNAPGSDSMVETVRLTPASRTTDGNGERPTAAFPTAAGPVAKSVSASGRIATRYSLRGATGTTLPVRSAIAAEIRFDNHVRARAVRSE